jgi:HPt (histidine-containing phosphotransfer) domain-containing protein
MKVMRRSIQVQVSRELRDLIPRFLANRRVDIAQLDDAVARGDLEAARGIGHSLRGAGGGYGFDEITRLGAEIEACAKAGGDGLPALVRELAEYLDSVEVTFD